jgi:uncharacterized RDD family membrane protein YckC
MEQMENLLNDFEEPQYRYVGFLPRFGALFIDGLILLVVNYLLRIPLAELDNNLVALIIAAIVPLFYNLFLEYKYGATLGKMLLKIRIVNYELQPPTISNVILRNIIYIGLQFVSFGIELKGYFNIQSSGSDFTEFNDFITPQLIITLLFSGSVFIIYIIEMIFLLNDPKFRALHDRIGKTYVVKSTA